MNGQPAVSVEKLVIAFGAFHAVDGISFRVERGEIFGFLGANGAGKTTTIRALCGLLLPTAGKISVAGQDINAGLKNIKARVGYMSQKFTLYPTLTVRENIAFAGALRKMTPADISKRSSELFRFTGFDRDMDEKVKNLPGGVKQIVALCACLLHDPEIIFLDEPTAGVAPSSRALFWSLIGTLAKAGKTVFVTTHYMDEAEQCGRIALMQAGKIIALDTPAMLKKNNFPSPFYEITPPEGDNAAFETLLTASGAGPVQPCGLHFHLEAQNAAAWKNFCAAQEGKFTFRPVAPTLEDVFLKLVGGGDK